MNKKLDDMLQIYTKNLEKEPQNAVLLYNIGLIKFLKKEYEEIARNNGYFDSNKDKMPWF